MLTPGRQIDEVVMGRYYSQWAMIQRIRKHARSGQLLAIRLDQQESARQFDRILRIIDN